MKGVLAKDHQGHNREVALLREGHINRNFPKFKAVMKKDQFSKIAAAVITMDKSDVLLATSTDEKLDWILNSSSAYHLCGDREMFSIYAACDDGLVWMVNNTTNRVIGK